MRKLKELNLRRAVDGEDYAVCSILNALASRQHRLMVEKGFYDDEPEAPAYESEEEDRFLERSCNNLHDEVSELHTAWRERDLNNHCDKAEKMLEMGLPPLTCMEEELADIILRVVDICGYMGVDLTGAVTTKMILNATRPKRHGGKKS